MNIKINLECGKMARIDGQDKIVLPETSSEITFDSRTYAIDDLIVIAKNGKKEIKKRVTDAYYSRCQRGFHMSSAAPFGFKLEPTTIQGIRTKMMVPDEECADIARLMFEMYAAPSTSFGDIARPIGVEVSNFSVEDTNSTLYA